MAYECRVETDSISIAGHRLTTFVATFPRIVLAEFNTHRMFSRNSASSRAIPVEKQIKKIEEDMFSPIYWGKNQKGMSSEEELPPDAIETAKSLWRSCASVMVGGAKNLMDEGVHKQITNRLLEPFMWHTAVVTATEWSNFFNLRDNKHAQPEIREIAHMMREQYGKSEPRCLGDGDWHLPFVSFDDEISTLSMDNLAKVSAARSARVSYLTHDGMRDIKEDFALYDRLVGPGHMSPLEHPARPMTDSELAIFRQKHMVWNGLLRMFEWDGTYTHFLGNYEGWVQLRKMIPGEHDILGSR